VLVVLSTYKPDRTEVYGILDMARTHGEREGAALASYQRLAEESDDEGLRYLVRLIMEDEIRHHQQISEIVNELDSFVSDLDIQPRPPHLGRGLGTSLRKETDRLLAIEKEDAKELRRFRKELRGYTGYALLPLLVTLMLHDTAKHIAILKVVRSR
jgi:hypothetical protein